MISAEYAAGFFDGEGTVALTKRKYGYALQAAAAQNSRPVLEALQERWGGSVSTNRRGQHVWSAWSNDASAFLRDILPYVIVKRERVELALEYAETMKGRGSYHANNRVPDDVRSLRDSIYRRFYPNKEIRCPA